MATINIPGLGGITTFVASVQPAKIYPSIEVTEGLIETLGTSLVPFLLKQYRDFSELITGGPVQKLLRGERKILYGLQEEIVYMATAQGGKKNVEAVKQLTKLSQAMVPKASWPNPLKRISRALSETSSVQQLPWVVGLLPPGTQIILNTRPYHGLTSCGPYTAMFSASASMQHMLNTFSEDPGSYVTTLFSGNLWTHSDTLLAASTFLHEASHYANYFEIESWRNRNVARDEATRDPAFIRHASLSTDGQHRVDLGFATLFLELAAYHATRTYFGYERKKAGQDKDQKLSIAATKTIEESIMAAWSYMKNPLYTPYLLQAGIELPSDTTNLTDTTIIDIEKQFTGIIWR